MPLPWKKSKSGRISRFVTDLRKSPKRGGSLVVETGFPTSLIDLFFKNRDRVKKPSSRCRQSTVDPPSTLRPSPPPPSQRKQSPFPLPVAEAPSREEPVRRETIGASNKIDERITGENRSYGYGNACVLLVMTKVFAAAVLALSTKKLTVGITLSASALLFMEFAVARVFTILKICPKSPSRFALFLQKMLGKRRKERLMVMDDNSLISCQRTEAFEDSRNCTDGTWDCTCTDAVTCSEPGSEVIRDLESSVDWKRGQTQTIQDVVCKNNRSKSSKLKSKIVNKIVPKKLLSLKKKKKKSTNIKEGKERDEEEPEEEDARSLTEVSSFVSDNQSQRNGGEMYERHDDDSYPPSLESCTEAEETRDGSTKRANNGNKEGAIALLVIVLVGLSGGKVLATALILSWYLIRTFFSSLLKTRRTAAASG